MFSSYDTLSGMAPDTYAKHRAVYWIPEILGTITTRRQLDKSLTIAKATRPIKVSVMNREDEMRCVADDSPG